MKIGVGISVCHDSSELWTPASLGSKCKLWLEARYGVTAPSPTYRVSAWANQAAGATVHAVQANGPKQPLWQSNTSLNGKPAIYFDGITYCLKTSGPIALAQFTIVAAVKLDAALQANGMLWETGANANVDRGCWCLAQNAPAWNVVRTSYTSSANPAIPRDSTWRTVVMEWAGTPSTTRVYYNGVNQGITFGGSGSSNESVSTIINIGSRNDGAGFPLMGWVSGMFFCDLLTAPERDALVAYAGRL